MYFTQAAIIWLFGAAELVSGAAVTHRRRGAQPSYPVDEKATKDCTWWHDYDDKIPCEEILKSNSIGIKQFQRWNPSISSDCSGLTVGRSYCVEAMFESGTGPEPEPSSKPEPSPTKPSNGIETPANIQPGMVSNCNKFYMVKMGEGCAQVASMHGITLAQFTEWNSGVGETCNGLWAETYACVSIIGSKPSPTAPTATNGIRTPAPIQEGIVKNCNKFHLVKKTTTCASIEDYYKLPLATFKKWNPAVGSDCRTLLAHYWVCVSTVDYKPDPVVTSKPSPTTPSNGIKTPSPIQTNMHKNCDKFHVIKSTTTCVSISDYYKLPLKDFYSWNPSVGSSCQALLVDYWVCVSIVGWKPPTPSPTNPGNGIKTPLPIQAGMTAKCNKFHVVQKTTTCSSIQNYYSITMAQLFEWNPAIGSKCTSLWVDYNVCVGVIGQKPNPTQPPQSNATPTPIQADTVKNCKKFHLVKKTTTCSSIQNYYKITMAQLAKWNPAVGTKCTGLWADYWVCVSA
ncbi:hypothetical protein FOXG_17687 [Fusarium oxysporum f. sp. lycopersici 4287]|uniref:LysM domain-containing protein n=1 Tax=Fusarium oxysporum f. sp. lycopersici (strain 4287 / CBS 123668 / FGSC 9935 / NRRL 34936) TaxID=426428 RepID=A0A0J9WDF7_FUSO4|nr:uncharacterized protein FOXG_17687 [Fusarium oxysporum f. sp. lycopersici 4287]KAJ9421242.1 hypothetical protein QL093DRAFT_1421346 [Fusarium oxysporum]KNB20761.1 hypothetical protein FOXG_17687 [Fusarium oxysporum f. sp. lycopersici 4287]